MAIFHAETSSPSSPRHSITGTRWTCAAPVDQMPEGLHPAVGQVLASRGILTPREMDTFLNAPLTALHDPLLLPEMTGAVAAIQEVLARGGRIRVFGDYDADGITATALLVRALGALGGNVDSYLPHRIDDGYGLNAKALEEAREGDVVVLAGKGHETYQILKDGKIDFDDREVARKVLAEMGYGK